MKKMMTRLLTPVATALLSVLLCGCQYPKEKSSEPVVVAAPTPKPAPKPVVTDVEPPAKSQWKVTASALQEDIFPAAFACDGKTDTRWSSPPSDPQWLQIDMGQPATICGLSILWETAFASEYSILTSLDGVKWDEVWSTKSGDGRTDEIYFQPTRAQFVKILCLKRGTGWGDSIFDGQHQGPGRSARDRNTGDDPDG